MIALLSQTLERILLRANQDDPRGAGWDQLHEAGLLDPFAQGLEHWSEGAELIRVASAQAPAIPFAEQLVSSYVAKQLQVSLDGHFTTLADPSMSDLLLSDAGITGHARMVPHVAVASQLWVDAQGRAPHERVVALMEIRGIEARSGRNLAREPRDALRVVNAPVIFELTHGSSIPPLLWLGALARATQMAALSEHVLTACLEHARTRMQFGRTIGTFQAVQQELAVLACDVSALHAAVDAAALALDATGLIGIERAAEPVAAAKVQAGATARRAVEVGHAVHAAIGFTREHSLHRYTQRLLSYRAEFGADRLFAGFLGRRAHAHGPDTLWANLVAGATPLSSDKQESPP